VEKDGKQKRRKFWAKYKAATVRLMQHSAKSIGQVALELGIGETALRRWVSQAEVEAGHGPEGALKRSEREELLELRRENRRLRMEREILKKATASSPRRAGNGWDHALAESFFATLKIEYFPCRQPLRSSFPTSTPALCR
jgi:transposase